MQLSASQLQYQVHQQQQQHQSMYFHRPPKIESPMRWKGNKRTDSNQHLVAPLPPPKIYRQQLQQHESRLVRTPMIPQRAVATDQLHGRQQPPSLAQPIAAPTTMTATRIPTMTQNFNEISKTATNLLNDIYERHLLSQTTFESASASASPVVATTVQSSGSATSTHQQQSSNAVALKCALATNENRPSESDFNFNNLCYQQTTAAPNQRPKNALTLKLIANKVSNKSKMPKHVTNAKSNAPGECRRTTSNSVTEKDKENVNETCENGINNGVSSTPVTATHHQVLTRRYGSDKVQHPRKFSMTYMMPNHSQDTNAASTSTAAIGHHESAQKSSGNGMATIIENNTFYEASDYVGHRKQFTRNDIVGVGIKTKMTESKTSAATGKRGEPVGGNFYVTATAASPLAVISTIDAKPPPTEAKPSLNKGEKSSSANAEFANNSKINIMLETAQAMAAAAYFARFV